MALLNDPIIAMSAMIILTIVVGALYRAKWFRRIADKLF